MATYSITGTCVYCGQMATLNASEPMEGAEANKYITDHCSCDCARHARWSDEVRGSVDKLFGNLIDVVDDGTLIEATWLTRLTKGR